MTGSVVSTDTQMEKARLLRLGKKRPVTGSLRHSWADTLGEEDDITRAARTWRHEGIIRGMGKPNHQSKQQFRLRQPTRRLQLPGFSVQLSGKPMYST